MTNELLKEINFNVNVINITKDVYYSTYFLFISPVTHPTKDKNFCLIVSFPKSGRTWLRALLAKYLEITYKIPFDDDFCNFPKNIISLEFNHYEKYKKAVILVRDPRDVLVSNYHQRTKRSSQKQYKGNMSKFIRSRWGIRRIVYFLNKVVKYVPSKAKVLYISYEAMRKNTEKELTKLLKFLEWPINKKALTGSIEFCKFENMQKLERQNAFKNRRLRPSNNKSIDSFKVRKGEIGGYADELRKEDIIYVEKYISKYLNKKMIKKFSYKPISVAN